MQMKVCLEKSLNKHIFPPTRSSQLFINQNNTYNTKLAEKIIKLMYLPCNIKLCYITSCCVTWIYVYGCYKNSKILCGTVGSAPPCEILDTGSLDVKLDHR